jgi:phage host-nuclease inhibitor protein Gam
MQKWAALKRKVDLWQQPPEYQTKVDEAKGQYVGMEAAELAHRFAHHRNAKSALEEQIKGFNVELEALSQLLVENLESSEIQKVQLTTGETVYIQVEPYCAVQDKEALHAWIKKSKLQSLFTVNFQTMNGLVKEMLMAGKPAPPGVAVFLKTSARVRGGNHNED